MELIAILEYNDVDDFTDYLRKLHYDAKNELRRGSIGKRNSFEDKNLSGIKKVSYKCTANFVNLHYTKYEVLLYKFL